MLFGYTATGQESLGLKIENYSGINSVILNPANNTTSKFSWDVNLGAVGFFGATNYGYFKDVGLARLGRNYTDVIPATGNENIPSDAIIFDYYDNQRKKYFSSFGFLMGPSAMINLGNHTFGIFNNLRWAGSTQNLGPELNYYYFDRRPFFETFNVNQFNAAGMLWGELGLNYATSFPFGDGSLGIGANLKLLRGYEAFFFKNNTTIEVTQLPGDSTHLNKGNFDFGYTTNNIDFENIDPTIKNSGGGFAVDLGVVYTIDGGPDSYLFKLGASLLDIGRINFDKNAEAHQVITNDEFVIPQSQYTDVLSVDRWTKLFSAHSLSDSTASLHDDNFRIWLPGALSLQLDYGIASTFYVNATMVQRLPYNGQVAARSNMLAVTPRFEHRWFSAGLPIVLHNYQKVHVGAYARIAFFVLGTDNIGSVLGTSELTSMDFYFAIKINPFQTGFSFGGLGSDASRGKKVKCYEF